MLKKPVSEIGGVPEPFMPGDVLDVSELAPGVMSAADANYTMLGTDIAKMGDLYHTGISAGRSDTFPGAAEIINALRGAYNVISPPGNQLYGLGPNQNVALAWPANIMPFSPGSTFRRKIVSTAAFALTMLAPASVGITLKTAPNPTTVVAASSWREFLFMIMNSTPTIALTVDQTTGTKPLTVNAVYRALINQVTPGMSAYGTNIAAASKVASVNIDTGIITLDTNTTATIAGNVVTFTPSIDIYALGGGAL